MARIRTIKPEFWEDTKIGRITRDARLILIFLWYSSDNDNKSNYTLDFVKKELICTGTEKLFMRKSYKNYQIMD